MEKYITDERTGLKYELIGDYYLVAGEDEPAKPLGKWGCGCPVDTSSKQKHRPSRQARKRRRRHLKQNNRTLYDAMLISGRLESHLAEIDREATEMMETLTEKMKALEGITEKLKAEDQMAWVQAMNNIHSSVEEIIYCELIQT